MLDELVASIGIGRAEFERLRRRVPAALDSLRHYYDVELTFTSNAIEGNTLTLRETAELIEHGITVGGKPLRDHLEAEDHYQALTWMRALASGKACLGEETVTELHRRVVARSRPEIGGLYSPHSRRIAGSTAVFPNPLKIPALMAQFGVDLAAGALDAGAAFDLHFRLTAIHPFSDGNGRTARLLMNLLLIRGGYPPIAVRVGDRKAYLDTLGAGSLTGDRSGFQSLIHGRLDETLRDYIVSLAASAGSS